MGVNVQLFVALLKIVFSPSPPPPAQIQYAPQTQYMMAANPHQQFAQAAPKFMYVPSYGGGGGAPGAAGMSKQQHAAATTQYLLPGGAQQPTLFTDPTGKTYLISGAPPAQYHIPAMAAAGKVSCCWFVLRREGLDECVVVENLLYQEHKILQTNSISCFELFRKFEDK